MPGFLPEVLLVSCATAVACSPAVSYDGTEFSCAGGQSCPPGFECVGDVCVAPDGGADAVDAGGGPAPDARVPIDGPDAAVGALPCGSSMTEVSDDFDDGAIASVWAARYALGGAVVTEQGGRLTVDAATGAEGAFATMCDYDMTGGEVVIEVPSVGGTPGVAAFVRLERSPSEFAEMRADPDVLATTMIGGGQTANQTRAYDSIDDRWWRVRDLGISFEFSTSPDRIEWTVVGSQELPFSQAALRLSLGARADVGAISPVPIAMDNLNVP